MMLRNANRRLCSNLRVEEAAAAAAAMTPRKRKGGGGVDARRMLHRLQQLAGYSAALQLCASIIKLQYVTPPFWPHLSVIVTYVRKRPLPVFMHARYK